MRAGRKQFDHCPGLQQAGLALLLAVLGLAAGGGAWAAEKKGLLEGGMNLDGGIMDYDREKDAVVIRKYAVLTLGTTKVTARNMVYYKNTNEVYAEGDVVFEDASGSSFVCDRLFFHTLDWRGTAENVRVKAQKAEIRPPPPFVSTGIGGTRKPRSSSGRHGGGEVTRMFLHARELRSIGPKHHELIDAVLTPSSYYKPHWGIHSKAVNIRRGEKVESWHNFLKIGPVPVFYFPYIIYDLKYDWPWMRVSGGKTSEWGYHFNIETLMELDPKPDDLFRMHKIFMDLGFRQNRGWGLGLDANYKTGKGRSFGRIKFTNVYENLISDEEDSARARDHVETAVYRGMSNYKPDLYQDDFRWGLDWLHRQEFNERWDLRLEAHKYSDRDYRQEYDRIAFKEDKEPETWAGLRYLHPLWEAELIVQKRLNKWQSQSEYLPELRLTVPGFRLGSVPLYVKSDTRVGIVNRRFDYALDKYNRLNNDATRVKHGADYGEFARLHHETTINSPIHLGRFAVLTPYVGGRVTFYEKQYGRAGGDDRNVDSVNSALLWGADLSTRYYGIFGDGAWRHVLEPTISFVGNEKPDVPSAYLYQIDELDTYQESHYWSFALHNTLQTKTAKGGIRDVLDFDLDWRYYPRRGELDDVNFGRHSTEIRADLVFRPTKNLVLWGDALYDPHDNQFNTLVGGFDWIFRDRFRLYLRHQYLHGNTYRARRRGGIEQTTVGLRTLLWNKDSKWSAEIAGRYNWESNTAVTGLIEKRITLYYDLDTVELGVSLHMDEKYLGNKGIFVTITPKFTYAAISRLPEADGASREIDSRYGTPKAGSDDTGAEAGSRGVPDTLPEAQDP